MYEDLEIKHYYTPHFIKINTSTIKRKCEDFIVMETYKSNEVLIDDDIVNMSKFHISHNRIMSLPLNPTKEERKNIYEQSKYFPFIKLKTVNGNFVTENTDEDYFVFTLKKINQNTSDAIGILSMLLHIPYKEFSFSGNKDKKAITYQKIGCKVSFTKLFLLACHLKNDDDCLKKFSTIFNFIKTSDIIQFKKKDYMINIFDIHKGSPIKMGDHTGNRFKITIRDVNCDNIIPTKQFFLNYFGPQRFGKNCNNHKIGELIINKEYDLAIDMIYNDVFHNKTHDNGKSKIQRFIESQRHKGKTAKSIFFNLNRDSQMLYLHAYQSYIFNGAINERIQLTDVLNINEELNLVKLPSKFCKGGKRKIIEQIQDLRISKNKHDIIVEFTLNKSCYATMALRELFGNNIMLN